jgi:hypothetical protein
MRTKVVQQTHQRARRRTWSTPTLRSSTERAIELEDHSDTPEGVGGGTIHRERRDQNREMHVWSVHVEYMLTSVWTPPMYLPLDQGCEHHRENWCQLAHRSAQDGTGIGSRLATNHHESNSWCHLHRLDCRGSSWDEYQLVTPTAVSRSTRRGTWHGDRHGSPYMES